MDTYTPATLELDTPHGLARVHLRAADNATAALVLGHGAGGGVQAPDLQATARAASSLGIGVALIEQPYRVAGRRSQAPAAQLDAAWLAVIEQLRGGVLRDAPLVVGGRSAGARVACRTASAAGAEGVVCLAFPLHPPGQAHDPAKSRLPELQSVKVPVLVVQGESDPFGMPPDGPNRLVVRVRGNHSLKTTSPVEAAVTAWLTQFTS
jgi:predicted alpha/beta-hydrolase family hydrolase